MHRIDSTPGVSAIVESARSDHFPHDRSKAVLLSLFLMSGMAITTWLSRLPSIRDALNLELSQVGRVLLCGAVGALIVSLVAGPMTAKFGGVVCLRASGVLITTAYVLFGFSTVVGSVPMLMAAIFCHGLCTPMANVPLNVESAGVERRAGHSVLPQFHAAYSVGCVLGSLIGAGCAAIHIPVIAQLAVIGVIFGAWRFFAAQVVVRDTALGAHHEISLPATAAPSAPVHHRPYTTAMAWREHRTLLLGLIIGVAAFGEGAANDWLSLGVVDGFTETEAVGAVVFGTFVAAMMLVRFMGTWLIDTFGRDRVLRLSGIAAAVGVLGFTFAPNLYLAAVGVFVWGAGSALASPIVIAAASDNAAAAAARVAVVCAFVPVASIAEPLVFGFASQHVGARRALVLVIAGLVLSIALSGRTKPDNAAVPGTSVPQPATVPTAADPKTAASGLGHNQPGPHSADGNPHPADGTPTAADGTAPRLPGRKAGGHPARRGPTRRRNTPPGAPRPRRLGNLGRTRS